MRFPALFLALLLGHSLCPRVAKCEVPASAAASNTILSSAARAECYDSEFSMLSRNLRMMVLRHGLRGVPLDPAVWGHLRWEKTQNRDFVPIRRFFLRASEDPAFSLSSIEFNFSFHKVNPHYLEKVPHLKESILDIGLGGRVSFNNLTAQEHSSGYAVRFSAMNDVSSGVCALDGSHYTLLAPLAKVETGRVYHVSINISSDQLRIRLDDLPEQRLNLNGLAHGLVWAIAGWNGASLTDLKLTARSAGSNSSQEHSLNSGLITMVARD